MMRINLIFNTNTYKTIKNLLSIRLKFYWLVNQSKMHAKAVIIIYPLVSL